LSWGAALVTLGAEAYLGHVELENRD